MQTKRKAPVQANANKGAKRQRGNRGQRIDLPAAPVSLGYGRPNVSMRSAAPSRAGGEVRIVGCDYIGSITADTTATDGYYELNPTNATTFPRLNAMAEVFGKYAFNRLRFYAVGKAASTQPGDMTSVTVYDGRAGGAALSESQVKNRFGQVTSKFWENHVHEVDTRKATVPWFLCQVPSGNDSDTTTFGWYHFFTEAVATASPVADIFVDYDIEFCEAQAVADPD